MEYVGKETLGSNMIWRSVLRGLAWSCLLITLAYTSLGVAKKIDFIPKTLSHQAYRQQVFLSIIEPVIFPLKLFKISLLPTVFLFWLSGIGKKKQDKDI